VTAPEGSDYDSNDDDSRDSATDDNHNEPSPIIQLASQSQNSVLPDTKARGDVELSSQQPVATLTGSRRKRHDLRYHVGILLLGFLSICLACYVLSHVATTIPDLFGISDVFFGVIILALATALAEKVHCGPQWIPRTCWNPGCQYSRKQYFPFVALHGHYNGRD
jgi:Ca2+/Na+ antiporter